MMLDADTIQECWNVIDKSIAKGQLSGNGCDQMAERNGLILAANLLASMLPDWEADPGQERREDGLLERLYAAPKPGDQEGLYREIADSFYPRSMDAEPMTKAEIIHRRWQGQFMNRFGKNYLSCVTDDGIPVVLVGNPEQMITIEEV